MKEKNNMRAYLCERDLTICVCFDYVLGPPSMCFILILFIVYTVNSSFKFMLLDFFFFELTYFVYISFCTVLHEGQVLVLNVHKNL